LRHSSSNKETSAKVGAAVAVAHKFQRSQLESILERQPRETHSSEKSSKRPSSASKKAVKIIKQSKLKPLNSESKRQKANSENRNPNEELSSKSRNRKEQKPLTPLDLVSIDTRGSCTQAESESRVRRVEKKQTISIEDPSISYQILIEDGTSYPKNIFSVPLMSSVHNDSLQSSAR
jgi:hypothetical protein